jgi:hypothetical protein
MNENAEHPAPVTVVALRAESYSAEEDTIVVSLRVKYSTADRFYSIPVECLRDLIVDLRRLSISAPPTQPDHTDGETEPARDLGSS